MILNQIHLSGPLPLFLDKVKVTLLTLTTTQVHGGGSYTPSSKKRPPNQDTNLLPYHHKQGHTAQQSEGSVSQPKYLGATALQAIQILNTQTQAHNTSQPNITGLTEIGRINATPIDQAHPKDQVPKSLFHLPHNVLLTLDKAL